MVVTAAIIGGTALLGSAAIGSSGGKKGGGGGGQELLAQVAQQLFTETEPLRAETISAALKAMREGSADSPALQQTLSAISAGGERQKQNLRSRLTGEGLSDSSVGIAAEEDIDRAISQLLASAKTDELQRLLNIGRSVGFGQAPATAASAAGDLARVQALERSARAERTSSAGEAAALLLLRQTRPKAPSDQDLEFYVDEAQTR